MKQSLTAATSNRLQFVFLSASMFVQNAMFFVLWAVFFRSVHDVAGWQLSELGLFIGILCVGVGSAFFLGEGSRRIAQRIRDGDLDVFLLRPRHVLPQLISMEASASSIGDIVYGLTLILALGRPDWEGFAFAIGAALCVGGLFLSMVVIFQSLAFFVSGGSRLADELFVAMICLSSVPQHTQGLAMKIVLFTVLPAGFMAILPVDMVRHHSLILLGISAGAVVFYAGFAAGFFRLGLKRYTSAT